MRDVVALMLFHFRNRGANAIRAKRLRRAVSRLAIGLTGPEPIRLGVDVLEDRRLLSAAPQLVYDFAPGDESAVVAPIVSTGPEAFFATGDYVGAQNAMLWKSDGTDAGTVLVSQASYLTNLTEVAGTIFFSAYDGTTGYELWKSDGTTAGTVVVKDIAPGSGSSFPRNLVNANGLLLFTTSGRQLWKSDGSESGTVYVADVGYASNFTTAGNYVFFQSADNANDDELWITDGTAGGTHRVKDIKSTGSSNPRSLTEVGGTLFFIADDDTHTNALWRSDGTEAGTVFVRDFDSPANLLAIGDTLYLTEANGSQLWKSVPGTGDTELVKDFQIGPGQASVTGLMNFSGALFFGASDGAGNSGLWTSDGTTAGTTLVKSGPVPTGSGSSVSNGVLYFGANDGASGSELWKSDGTAAGTTMVADIAPGTSGSAPTAFQQVGSQVVFIADDGTHGAELWATDGTSGGTMLVTDINTHGNSSDPRLPFAFRGNTAFWRQQNVIATDGLWIYDGNSPSHPSIRDENLDADRLAVVNDYLYYWGFDSNGIQALKKTDGTIAGTTALKDFTTDIRIFTNVNGTLYFLAKKTDVTWDLWMSNGTASGTVLVKALNTYQTGHRPLTNVNGVLYISTHDGLYKSDGTSAGTVHLGNYAPADNVTQSGNMVFFTSTKSTTDVQLWKTDGTAAGTVLVKDQIAPSGAFLGQSLANVNGTLFFVVQRTSIPSEWDLWKTDGSIAGTMLVRQFGSMPSSFTNLNGTLAFFGQDVDFQTKLWISDGTQSGTVPVYSGPSLAFTSPLTNVNGTLVFSANDPVHGEEIWESDGTTAGTHPLEILPGSDGFLSRPLLDENSVTIADTLYFAADTQTTGNELWKLSETTLPSLIVPTVTSSEGDSGTSAMVFTLGLSAPIDRVALVRYTTVDGTATAADNDYQAQSGTITFAPGQTTYELTIPIVGDARNEPDETFTVAFSSFTNVQWTSATATGTILNDDPLPSIGLMPSTVSEIEGNSGTTPIPVTIALSGPSGKQITVTYATSSGSAIAGSDYVEASGTVTFAPDVTRQVVTIAVLGDAINEADETFYVSLGDAVNAVVDGSLTTVTIANDDPLPSLSAATVEAREGDSGLASFVVPVSLSSVSGQPITVHYETVDGTATADTGDYLSASGDITFPVGVQTCPVTLLVVGDTLNEPDEAFSLVLSNPSNATIGNSESAVLIQNDDRTIDWLQSTVMATEGDSGLSQMVFSLVLSAPSDYPITAHYMTVDGSADSAQPDYIASSGTITFAPGETVQSIAIDVVGDAINEADESFTLVLSDSVNAVVNVASALGVVANDDPLPILAISPVEVSMLEGASGTSNANFTVNLSAVSGQTVTVRYQTNDGTAKVADNDYQATSGTLVFSPGVQTLTFSVPIVGDRRVETDESFSITLSAATNAVLGDSLSTVTIVNDDVSVIGGAKLFYRGSSAWDVTNNNLPGFSDDNAIAPDKSAYLPGSGTATFANVSSYTRGINGLMVDLAGSHGTITANDFIFKVGNNNSPSLWATAAAPTLVTTRSGAGVSGSDRVELMWASNAIQKTWLEVIVKGYDTLGGSNNNTGLTSSYVFYFGSAVGDSGAGDTTTFVVNSTDEISARNDPHSVLSNRALITNVNDFNRDGNVNATDQIASRNNATSALSTALKFLTVGAGGPFAPASDGGAITASPAAATGDRGISSGLAATSSSSTSTTGVSAPGWINERLDALAASAPSTGSARAVADAVLGVDSGDDENNSLSDLLAEIASNEL